MRRIVLLDSLRGIAALIVFFHHSFLKFNYLFKKIESNFIYNILDFISDLNVEAVLFFFILSGFSIRISTQNYNFNSNVDINKYLYKRFKRILPTYLLAIFLTFIIGLADNKTYLPDFSFSNLLGNLFFMQTSKNVGDYWFSPYGLNGPLWSLSYEMFYYIMYPAFYRIIKAVNKKIKKIDFYDLFLLIIIPVSISSVLFRKLFFMPWFSFLTYFYIWYLGVYAANIYLKKTNKSGVKIFALLFFSVVLKILNIYLLHSTTINNIFNSSLIFLFGILAYKNVRYLRKIGFNQIERVLNFVFKEIGLGSYSIYIFHFPILAYITGNYNVNGFLLFILSLAIIFVCVVFEKFITRFNFKIFKLNYLLVKNEK